MLCDQLGQIRILILVVLSKLVHYSLGFLKFFTGPRFPQALIHIITPAFRDQVSGIDREVALASLPLNTRIMLLDGRVDPRMIIACYQSDTT